MGPVWRVPSNFRGPSVFGPLQLLQLFVIFRLALWQAKFKGKTESKWVKQDWGNNGILRWDREKNFKGINYRYPPTFEPWLQLRYTRQFALSQTLPSIDTRNYSTILWFYDEPSLPVHLHVMCRWMKTTLAIVFSSMSVHCLILSVARRWQCIYLII